MYIEVTDPKTDAKILVNSQYIVSVCPGTRYTILEMADGDQFRIRETYEYIKEKLL